MKTVVSSLHFDVVLTNYNHQTVAADSSFGDDLDGVAEYIQKVAAKIDEVLHNYGFYSDSVALPENHVTDDGTSLYAIYFWDNAGTTVKLAVTVRLSDHKAKPSYSESRDRAADKFNRKYKTDVLKKFDISGIELDYLDVACKQHGWGVQYFVGTASDYTESTDSFERAMTILEGRLNKIVLKYS